MHIVSTEELNTGILEKFFDLIGEVRSARLRAAADALRQELGPGTLWHVNSTDTGGGVAEILHVLVPLYRYLGVRAGWIVIGGNDPFFTVTKHLGNLVYGSTDDADEMQPDGRQVYLDVLAANAAEIRDVVGRDDLVLLHDHQTAGLVELLSGTGARTYWRCHIGIDEPNSGSQAAWAFMAPLLSSATGLVFSVSQHVPAELSDRSRAIIPPTIWPFSPKNRSLSESAIRKRMALCGLRNGTPVAPTEAIQVVADEWPDPDAPLILQVSRWDRLKDMHGVLEAFGTHVPEGHLALLGPNPISIPDDREQDRWFRTCLDAWHALPRAARKRVSLVCLPMTDLNENALLVNAVQRSATLVVQKSLAEGFGLTVTEAMWKGKPVLGSAVGGIAEQITHGHNGLLLDDPWDQVTFGNLMTSVLRGAVDHGKLGRQAHYDVHHDFLPDRDIIATALLVAGGNHTPLIPA